MTADATYTVGEMAARIARTDAPEEVAAITRQLRNWSALRLLTPVGELHGGTGRHRRYDQGELFKAALLELLARNFRVDVTGLQKISEYFARIAAPAPGLDTDWFREVERFRTGPYHTFLLVSFDEEGNLYMQELPAGASMGPDLYELSFVADLTAIARRVFR
jgi:hypothetical protein